MTEPDWVEMYGMAFSAGVANSGLLITLMSGYLVAAYLVGKRLTGDVTTKALSLVFLVSLAAHPGVQGESDGADHKRLAAACTPSPVIMQSDYQYPQTTCGNCAVIVNCGRMRKMNRHQENP